MTTEIKIDPVKRNGFELRTEGNTVFFIGNIDQTRPDESMEPFIQEVHKAVIANNIQEINVDLTRLFFLNSSGIRELVDWVMKMNLLPDEQKYRIRFICNNKHKWQESSMRILTYLNPDYLSRTTIDG